MAYDPRNDNRRPKVRESNPKDRRGRRHFASLKELKDWEKVCGPFARSGSYVKKVTVPADDRWPEQTRYERFYWGAN